MDLNTNALISLEDLKNLLGIDSTDVDQDLSLTIYINGISDYIQGVGNTILKADYTEKYQGTGTQELILNHRPINTATVKINESEITDFEILKGRGILFRDFGWHMQGSSFPMMHDRVNQAYKTIEVNYNAGFKTVPGDLMMLVSALIKNQRDYDKQGNLKSYKISDVAKTWGEEAVKLSPQHQTILLKYRGFKV